MSDPNFIILYAADVGRSATFYESLLGKPPLESSPTFAMFALSSGVMLGLWSRHTVIPSASAPAGSGELAFALADDAAVDARHARWRAAGLEMVQQPCRLDFGYTFVALDPDGHRLRAFAPGAQ